MQSQPPAIVIPARRPGNIGTPASSPSGPTLSATAAPQTRTLSFEEGSRLPREQRERASSSPEVALELLRPDQGHTGSFVSHVIDIGAAKPPTAPVFPGRGSSPSSTYPSPGSFSQPSFGPLSPTSIALQDLFAEFVAAAETKIGAVGSMSLDRELDLSSSIRPGAEPSFDRLCLALGSLGKFAPRSLIDSLIAWRKYKGDQFEAAFKGGTLDLRSREVLRERKSLMANFLVCRLMYEVLQGYRGADPDLSLPEDLASKIEDMIFAQIRNSDPEVIAKSASRMANIDMFAELTGPLSLIRFISVGDRFIAELNRISATRDLKIEQVTRCMRFLRFKIYPMDALEATADFLQAVAVSFQNAHTTRTKHAFAEVLIELLEPVAVVASADATFPSWTKTVDMLYPRTFKMAQKPRHFHVAIPLLTTLLSVAPKAFFLNHWGSLVDLIVPKLKERSMPIRRLALSCWVRLLWLYIFRCPDAAVTSVNKRLDTTFRTLFPARGRGIVPPDTIGAADSLSKLIVYVGSRYWDYAIDGLVLPLLNYDSIANSNLLVASATWISGLNTFSGSGGVHGSLSSPASGSAASLIVGGEADNTFDKLLSTYEPFLSPERQSISLRAFYWLLAELEQALSSSSQSGHAVTRSVHRGAADSSRLPMAVLPSIPTPSMPLLVDVSMTSQGKSVSGEWDFLRRASASVATLETNSASALPKHTERYRTRSMTGDFYRDNISAANVALPPQFWAKAGQHLKDGYEKVTTVLGRLLSMLDQLVGSLLMTGDAGVLRDSAPALSAQSSTASVTSERQSLSSAVLSATSSLLPGSLRRGTSQVSLASAGSAEESEVTGRDLPRNKALLIDLLRTCIDGIPRCVHRSFSSTKVLEMLTKYTMHADDGLRRASLEALRRILRTSDPTERRWWLGQEGSEGSPSPTSIPLCLSARIARIFVDALSWTSNERIGDFVIMRSGDELESSSSGYGVGGLLMFIVELAQEWCAELGQQQASASDAIDHALDEIDQWGVSLLSSSSFGVRRYGVRLLKLTNPTFVTPGAEPQGGAPRSARRHSRVFDILREASCRILAAHDVVSAGDSNDLCSLACSSAPEAQALWLRLFPDIARELFAKASSTLLSATLETFSRRIAQLQPGINAAAELGVSTTAGSSTFSSYRNFLPGSRSSVSVLPVLPATDEIVSQWRCYITFACCQVDSTSPSATSPNMRATRDSGQARSVVYGPRQLFQLLLPLLAAERPSIRLAAVTALGSVHPNVFGILFQEAQPLLRTVLDEGLSRVASHLDAMGSVRSLSLTSPRRSFSFSASNLFGGMLGSNIVGRKADRLRAEVAQLFASTIGLLRYEECGNDAFLLQGLLQYLVETARFLVDPTIQAEWDHQMLRYYFASFVQKLYETLTVTNREGLIARHATSPVGTDAAPNVKREHDPRANKAAELVRRMMSYEIRHVLFKLVESWCGYGVPSLVFRDKQSRTIAGILDSLKDPKERGSLSSAIEEQKKALEFASSRALCALCRGAIAAEPLPAESDSGQRVAKVLMEPSVVDELKMLAGVLGIQVNGQILPFDIDSLLQFVDASFVASDERYPSIAIGALEGLLSANQANFSLVDKAVRQAYSQRSPHSARGYFLALARVYSRATVFPGGVARFIALALVKIGDSDPLVRREALTLLDRLATLAPFASEAPVRELLNNFLPVASTSEVPQTFLFAQAMVSTAMASLYGDLTRKVICEIVFWSDPISAMHGSGDRDCVPDLFTILLPWVKNAAFDGTLTSKEHKPAQTLMSNLLYLTHKHGDSCGPLVQRLWATLAGAVDVDSGFEPGDGPSPEAIRDNASAICSFLLASGIENRNPLWIHAAKRVVVALCRSSACAATIRSLSSAIAPANMIPGQLVSDQGIALDTAGAPSKAQSVEPQGLAPAPVAASSLHVADLAKIFPPVANGVLASVAQLASILLAEALVDIDVDTVLEILPDVLHISVLHLDQISTYLGDEHRRALLALVRIVFASAKNVAGIAELEASLERSRFWAYEDASPDNEVIPSSQHMATLVLLIMDVFGVADPSLLARWGDLALNWSLLCPVRHAACRSLQVFRTLLAPTRASRLGDLLVRLSRAIADTRAEAQGFSLEALLTFNVLFDALDRDQFLQQPHFFWVAVAVLSSPHDWEFGQGLKALQRILSFMDIEDPKIQDLIYQALPNGWSGSFSGLQPLLLRGLRLPRVSTDALELLNSLMNIKMDALVDLSQGRMLFTVLANLPSLVMAMNPVAGPRTSAGFQSTAKGDEKSTHVRLAAALRAHRQDLAAQLVESCLKPRYFRSKEDFLKNLLPVLFQTYPSFVWESLTFLLSLLQLPDVKYRTAVLQTLKGLVACVNMKEHTAGIALDHTLAPLYRAARGECSDLAIEVLAELARHDRTEPDAGNLTLFGDFGRTPSSDVVRSSSGVNAFDSDGGFEALAHVTKANVAAVAMALVALDAPPEGDVQDGPHPSTPILGTSEIANDVSLVDLVNADFQKLEISESESPVMDSEDRLVLADELIGRHLRGEPAEEPARRGHSRSTTSSVSAGLSAESPSPPTYSVPNSPMSSLGSAGSIAQHGKTGSATSVDSL